MGCGEPNLEAKSYLVTGTDERREPRALTCLWAVPVQLHLQGPARGLRSRVPGGVRVDGLDGTGPLTH